MRARIRTGQSRSGRPGFAGSQARRWIRLCLLPCAAFAVLAVGCGPVRAASLPDWAAEAAAAPLDEYAEEDAVVLLKDWDFTLEGGAREGTHRRVVKVLTEEGRDAAHLVVARSAFRSTERVRVWVQQPSGRVSVFGEDEGTLFRGASEKLLIDVQLLSINPPTIAPGSLVAAEYRFRASADLPQDVLPIQEESPVLLARVRARARGGWRLIARTSRQQNPGPAETAASGEWVFRDVPGLGVPEQEDSPVPPAVELGLDAVPPSGPDPFRDWHDVALWGARLFDEATKEAPRLARFLSTLPEGGSDVLAAAGTAARRLRYFGIELGWGGYRPRTVETTLERGFGDCKDKALLLVSALRARGVDAIPVLAVAPSHSHVAADLPGPLQFNHAIVGVPWHGTERPRGMAIVEAPGLGALRLYDPTLSDACAQDIPVQLEGGAGLALDPATTGLIRMPASSPADNRVERTLRWTIGTDGMARVREEVRFRGATRRWLEGEGGELIPADALREREVAANWERCPKFRGLEVGGVSRDPDGAWSYTVSFGCPEPFAVAESLRLLDLPSFQEPETFPIPRSKRPQTLSQSLLYSRVERTEIAHPGLKLVRAPTGFEETGAPGRVALRVEEEADRLILVREVALTASEIPPDQQTASARLRAALRRVNQTTVVFEAAAPDRSAPIPRPRGPVEELQPIEKPPR